MQKTRLSEELLLITDQLMMAKERSEVIRIASEFTALIEKLAALEKQGNEELRQQPKCVTAIMKFTEQEISEMATTFKREFIVNGLCAHILKRPSGKRYNTFCYEIRYRSNGYCIRASSTDLAEAKRKFIAKTMPGEIDKYRVTVGNTGLSKFSDVFEEWAEYKRGSITEKGLNSYRSSFYELPERLRKMPIENIRTINLSQVMKDVRPRKYEDLRTLFNGIFQYAIASGIISHNPVKLIPFKRAERESRDALSTEEIYSFLRNIQNERYDTIRQGAYILYFFGLRPCELDKDLHREGDFLIARNRKRKSGKIEYKKIPIPKPAENYIDWDKPLTFQCAETTRLKRFRELFEFNENCAYNLRHTFATICQKSVRQEIVEIWIGDSPQRLIGKFYTHFPDDFMREEMDKVKFPILEDLEGEKSGK